MDLRKSKDLFVTLPSVATVNTPPLLLLSTINVIILIDLLRMRNPTWVGAQKCDTSQV